MTTYYEIPVVPGRAQSFDLELLGVPYTFALAWNTAMLCWVLDLGDGSGAPLVQGVPLVPGADALAQHAWLEVGGALLLDAPDDAPPGFDDLGARCRLLFVTEP